MKCETTMYGMSNGEQTWFPILVVWWCEEMTKYINCIWMSADSSASHVLIQRSISVLLKSVSVVVYKNAFQSNSQISIQAVLQIKTTSHSILQNLEVKLLARTEFLRRHHIYMPVDCHYKLDNILVQQCSCTSTCQKM